MGTQANRELTPEEIKAECAKIRESWSEAEHYRRAGHRDGKPRWHPPGAEGQPLAAYRTRGGRSDE